jgi:TolB-like protein
LSGERVERRLAAILAADVAGYSRLMGQDEAGTLARLRAHRRELIDPKIAEHKGRVYSPDFRLSAKRPATASWSSSEAVACAVAVQRGMEKRNAGVPEDQRIVFRVGVNLGDVIVERDDIHGDGVNVAARLEALAEPGGICVSGTVREHVGDRLDLRFDDLGDQNLKNIARTIRVFRLRAADASVKPTPRALTLPDKPSIAVLPFLNISGDPEQEYFADGMVEEIITALSRIRWLFVIARNSSFTYKGQSVDVKQVARELGIRYVLEGSVRKAGNPVRITAQLINAETGAHLWADRFDGSLEDVFELQDKVASSVAGVIEPALQAAEIRRSSARPVIDLTAYDLYLQAVAVVRHVTRERVLKALGLIEQAIAIDRLYGPALALAALCHMRLVTDGWAIEPSTNRREAVNFAREALQVADNDPRVLANSAEVLAIFGEPIDATIGLIDRALALNPSFALGWNVSGLLRLYAGQPDLAIEHLETSLRLSPRERIGRPLYLMGVAYFLKREFDEAAAKLVLAVQDDPGFPATYRVLAACYAHMGRLDEAHAIVATLRAITPQIVPSVLPWRNPEDRELLLSGLRLAACESA